MKKIQALKKVLAVALTVAVAAPMFTGCKSSEDEYYSYVKKQSIDSLVGVWIGVNSQDWWFLPKKDTVAFKRSLASEAIVITKTGTDGKSGTMAGYYYLPVAKKWNLRWTAPFTTDGYSIVLSDNTLGVDNNKIKLEYKDAGWMAFSYSQDTEFSSIESYYLVDKLEAETPDEDVAYLYDEQLEEDSLGYWTLEASGPYDTQTGSKSRGVNDYPKGLSMELDNGFAAFIVGEQYCMDAYFEINENKLELSDTILYYDEGGIDDIYDQALDDLCEGGYIGGYYTTKDEDGDAVLILTLIVETEKDGYKWYDFSRYNYSETEAMKKLREIVNKNTKRKKK